MFGVVYGFVDYGTEMGGCITRVDGKNEKRRGGWEKAGGWEEGAGLML